MSPVNAETPTPLERQQIQVTDPEQQTFWHRVRFELVARHVARVGATRLLDIGAGSGLLGDWMLANRPGVAYRFEELSPLLDEQLTHRFGTERRSDPTEVVTADTLVALLDVVEHIEHDVDALSAIAARMEPGAQVVITAPALQWAFSSWDTELGHFRRYSRASLRRVVAAAGLEVDHVAYLFPELLPLLPLRKLRRAPRDHVDFPQLSPLVSRIGHAISTCTTRLRCLWPAGTSVVLTAHAPTATPTRECGRNG